MSCNGCRVLRKGCSETCILRPCLQWIESPEAQGHATVFVAKFFGRAGLMGFISAVPENQRPALFQSLLYEACGRTVNPVHGAVGLLWTGNWNVCQAAVETVFKGGALRPAASFPSSPKSMQSLPGRSQTATPRSKLLLAPEMAAVAQPAPEPFISTARCIEDLRPKRLLVESPSDGAARGTAAACFLQERPQMIKRHRNSEQDDKGEVGSNCGVAWVPKREPSQEPIISREQSQPAGLLFAPVARRALPHEDAAEMNQPLRLQASEGVLAGNAEGVELDLTLNSNPMAPSGRMKLGSVRVSSPSTISVNSEGSVTSLDCSELSMARWPARTPSPSSPREERQLLHLLL